MTIPTAVADEPVPASGWNAMKAAVESVAGLTLVSVTGNYTRASANSTYTDIDATNLKITFTAATTEVLLMAGFRVLSAASTQPVTFLIGYDLDGAADVEIGHMNQYGGATTIYGQTVFGAVVGSLTVGVEYVIKITWASDGDSLSCDDPWIGLFTGGSG